MDLRAMVEEFHRKYGAPVATAPTMTPVDERRFRADLMRAELAEYEAACEKDDMVEAYDALLDLLYVTIGSLVSHGFPLQEGFVEVHTSNMTKTAIKLAGTPRASKGASFRPPEPYLRRVLERAAKVTVRPQE